METTKTCKRCQQEKVMNTENFHPQKSSKDGLSTWCRACKKQYNAERYQKNAEKMKGQAKNWQQTNIIKSRKIKLRWKRKNDIIQELRNDGLIKDENNDV